MTTIGVRRSSMATTRGTRTSTMATRTTTTRTTRSECVLSGVLNKHRLVPRVAAKLLCPLWPFFACHTVIFTVDSTSASGLIANSWGLKHTTKLFVPCKNTLAYIKQGFSTILPLKYQHDSRGAWLKALLFMLD